MANQEHVDILKQGVEVWNTWRKKHRSTRPDFSKADLVGTNLSEANLSEANFRWASLGRTNLYKANLHSANLERANLSGANLSGANLNKANLSGANLSGADLMGSSLTMANFTMANLSEANLTMASLGGVDLSLANLRGANLRKADLTGVSLLFTNLTNVNLTGCSIFGISAWNVNLEGAVQKDLLITWHGKPEITVDNLEVAQFIYLLLNNSKIRDVINTITSKVVLILGRFTNERKPVLDALREELRKHNYCPVVFDFDPSEKRDLTETISLLARMSRFIIADLTDAKSLPQELENTVPHLPSVPVQPILHRDAREYAMFEHYERYPWVLPIYRYQDIPSLLASIKEHILKPIEQKEYEQDEKRVLEEEIRKLREENKRLRGGK